MKIFKYPLSMASYSFLKLPKNYEIIRVDQVEGEFYLWAIVDTRNDVTQQFFQCLPIPVLEEFTLQLPKNSEIIHVSDFNGKFYMWIKYESDDNYEPRYFECYKTGMEFKNPEMSLEYLGLCKLWIMQELGLYIFENRYKTNSKRGEKFWLQAENNPSVCTLDHNGNE